MLVMHGINGIPGTAGKNAITGTLGMRGWPGITGKSEMSGMFGFPRMPGISVMRGMSVKRGCLGYLQCLE